jgi:chemotaxis signal transduction protein
MRWDGMNPERQPLDRLVELRRAFDRSFAEAPSLQAGGLHDLLDIRLGATRYALRVAEIAGLFSAVKITPVPTAIAELLGIAAVRSSVLPVYDLCALTDHRADAQARWVAIAAGSPIGLAFDAFERHVRVGDDAILPQAGREHAVRHVREVVRVDGVVRPIISIPSVVESVTSRVVRSGAREKE